MQISDEDFREAYKPFPVAAHFIDAKTPEEKVIYALGQIGEGTAAEVQVFLASLTNEKLDEDGILRGLFNDGRIAGHEVDGIPLYNLSKITIANDDAVDPDLLAPGLD